MIDKARQYAQKAHEGQFRKDGKTPYFNHVDEVATIVSYFTDNPDIISAAYLHDTIEDNENIGYEEIHTVSNQVIASIVWELTNEYTKKRHPQLKRKERKRLECERIESISYSGKLIKLVDRLCNLKDYQQEDPDFNTNHHYVKESRELLEVLRGVNSHLEKEIEDILNGPERPKEPQIVLLREDKDPKNRSLNV